MKISDFVTNGLATVNPEEAPKESEVVLSYKSTDSNRVNLRHTRIVNKCLLCVMCYRYLVKCPV